MAWISHVVGCPLFSAQVPASLLGPSCCRLPAQRFHIQHSPSTASFALGPEVGPVSDVPNCPPSRRSTLPTLPLAPSPQHSPHRHIPSGGTWTSVCYGVFAAAPAFSHLISLSWTSPLTTAPPGSSCRDSFVLLCRAITPPLPKACC